MDGNVIARTATTTTTKHVVSKLIGLVEMEWYKLSSLRDDIDFMREELRSMHALLAKLGAADDDDDGGHLDVQVRAWRDEVRRLSADVEACVDDYRRRVAEDGAAHDDGGRKKNAVAAFFKNSSHKVATVGARHTIGSRIKKLKARINDINERRRRYRLDR
ncbi:putative disease resistance RPP13-like protein 3 [Panicum miliaceum]|uniref:Disease resistance RPP13-like protein 3 n=1 Tax=Panicum miliaceum TaxID=4540 RepID=A0A3L6PHM8_PANMI|nr:putative disease resistance RPP13-like protein 3 [Panicum miliaceum]